MAKNIYIRSSVDGSQCNILILVCVTFDKTLRATHTTKREKNITVVGQEGLGIVYVGANSMLSGNYMSEHDRVISEKLGFVLCGGDLSENTVVSEQYLLDLERKAFLELCREKKTLERIESIVKYGKILRN